MAEAPSGEGYWALSDEGIVSASGSVRHLGDLAALGKVNALSSSIDIAASPNGKGYWITTSTGVVYAFGSTRWHGATGHLDLPTSIVDIEPSPTGDGYWLTSAGGDIFAFGDAKFHGSAKEINLYRPAVDLISNPSGDGYWLVGSDGSVNGFGSAKFHGSLGHNKLSSTQIIGGHGTSDGNGYRLIGHRGGIFAFGSAYYAGSINASATAPVGAFAFDSVNKGYWLVTKNSPAVPSNSGIGKRAIFSNRLHRVWLVNVILSAEKQIRLYQVTTAFFPNLGALSLAMTISQWNIWFVSPGAILRQLVSTVFQMAVMESRFRLKLN